MTQSTYTGKLSNDAALVDARLELAILEAAHDVAPLFAANRWVWASLAAPGIPNEAEVAEKFRRLVRDLYRHGSERMATGRLVVSRTWDGPHSSLEFSLELGDVEEGPAC